LDILEVALLPAVANPVLALLVVISQISQHANRMKYIMMAIAAVIVGSPVDVDKL